MPSKWPNIVVKVENRYVAKLAKSVITIIIIIIIFHTNHIFVC